MKKNYYGSISIFFLFFLGFQLFGLIDKPRDCTAPPMRVTDMLLILLFLIIVWLLGYMTRREENL